MTLKITTIQEEYKKTIEIIVIKEEGKRPKPIIRIDNKIIENGTTLLGIAVEVFPKINFMEKTHFEEIEK